MASIAQIKLGCQTARQRISQDAPVLRLQPTNCVHPMFARQINVCPTQRSAILCNAAAPEAVYGSQWSTPPSAYLTVGLAHCFEKDDEGKIQDRYIIEPVSANSLECMSNGAKTCFMHVFSLTLEEAVSRNKSLLPAEFQAGMYCEDFEVRADACARTWMRPHAMDNLLDIVPLGQTKSSFNFDLTDRRVLNFENVVNDDDNIKQDISIDVYGRKEVEALQAKEDEDGEQPEAAADSDDDLDALLAD